YTDAAVRLEQHAHAVPGQQHDDWRRFRGKDSGGGQMTTARIVRLALDEVTPESWTPFGTIPSDENTEHDNADLEFLWNDGHVNFIGHSNDEIELSPAGGALCDLLNRHDTHTQTLMPFDADGFVVVAP